MFFSNASPLPQDYPQGGAACSTEFDCSLSGLCSNSRCVCDPWWTGPACDLLNLQNAASQAQGLQVPNYKSWGGHALAQGDGTFHGFFSFMCRHATLSDWTTKSSIWHATSTSAEGPYKLSDMVAPPWSHNAMIAQTFDAEHPFVLYQLGDAATPAAQWEPCYNASEVMPLTPPPPNPSVYLQLARTATAFTCAAPPPLPDPGPL